MGSNVCHAFIYGKIFIAKLFTFYEVLIYGFMLKMG